MTFEVPIDSGLSRHYDPANGLSLDKPLRGGDRSAPEHQDCKTLCNPFPTDVYYLGSFVRGVLFEEVSRVRVYGTARRRHGPRRPDEVP